MKKVVISLLLTLVSFISMAQESQTEYNFFRLPASAHSAALGGANITIIEDDPTLMFDNPALLGSVSDRTLNLNYMNFMAGANAASASFTKVLNDKASIGVAGQFLNYGKMKETDEHNVQTGEFSAKDIALSGTFSYMLADQWVGGITTRFITSYIGNYNSFAIGVDLGLNYYHPDNEWSVSAVVKNLGGELDAYEEEYGKLPLDVQVGVSKRLVGSPLRLSATFVDLNHLHYKLMNHVAVGADLILSPQIYVAMGYNFRRANEMTIVNDNEEKGSSHGAGFSFGAGLQLERFKLDVAYGKYHVSSHSLIINASFHL
ncbi:MAG: type IX secretion system protein PorQ [Prevotella sp.]|nr:type IX secretion system protein PorQ [Prevotella sp.]